MKVVISGGVHGNELIGIYLVKKLQHDFFEAKNISVDFLLANPKAIKMNRRYIDYDLNRAFSKEALTQDSHLYEFERAKVIQERLRNSDFLIDLHTTTANMGISVILSKKDEQSESVAKILAKEFEQVRIVQWFGSDEGDFINSLVPSSITIEVGHVCQGVLESDLFFSTLKVVKRTLDILEKNEICKEPHPAYKIEKYVDFPRRDGELFGMIHPELQGKDFTLLHRGDPIFLTFDEEEIFYDGESAYPLFINEAAYYEKNIAFCLSQKIAI